MSKVTTKLKVKDMQQSVRGFFSLDIDECNANAMVRGHRDTVVTSAEHNIQKGDYVVFKVRDEVFHDIADMVWEVGFVSSIPHSDGINGYGMVALSVFRVAGATFHRGDIGSAYIDDTIVIVKES